MKNNKRASYNIKGPFGQLGWIIKTPKSNPKKHIAPKVTPTSKKIKIHKIGKHGAIGLLTSKGMICAECRKFIKAKTPKKSIGKKEKFLPLNYQQRFFGRLLCKLGKHDWWLRPEGFIYCRFCGKHKL